MSEIDTRPANRGRSTTRGGRGGFGRGGPRGGRKQVNGASHDATQVDNSLEDEGELGEMKKKYSAELGMLKDMFPDWTDVDLVFALEEADGDVPNAVDKITEGSVSQFAEVKKPKDRARSKVKDDFSIAGAADKAGFAGRGSRGRGGFEGARGRGGRGADRARGGFRGGRGGHATANGAPKEAGATSVPTTESTAWDTPAAAPNNSWEDTTNAAATGSTGEPDQTTTDTTSVGDNASTAATQGASDAGQSAWGNVMTAESTPATASEGAKSSLIPEGGAKKSWASMFAKPKLAPIPVPKPAAKAPVPTPQAQAQPPPAELVASGQVPTALEQTVEEPVKEPEPAPALPAVEEPIAQSPAVVAAETPVETSASIPSSQDSNMPVAHDPLTEENVEHLPDESHPPSTLTAASTVGSTDPRMLTPLPGQQPPIGRPPLGGFSISAQRAAGAGVRSASFQRRVQEQQEAVVMPGHNAVDRAAVQFGSMGLNGEPGLDVDEEREEPETRQAPQHSPPTQPKASLPPAPRQAIPTQEPSIASVPETLTTPKQAPGLPPASQQNQQQIQDSNLGQTMPQDPMQASQNFGQYGGYGQGMQQEPAAQQQKPYDPFSHQAQGQFDRFGTQPPQQPSHSFGGLSSAPSDYSSYYTADAAQRNAYQQYYGTSAGYAPQDARSQQMQQQQDIGLGQQRSTSGFGASPADAAFGGQPAQQVGTTLSLTHLLRRLHSSQDEQERVQLQQQMDRMLQAHPELMSKDHRLSAIVPSATPTSPLRDVSNQQSLSTARSNHQAYIPNKPSQQTQPRYGDAPGSGHNTPNPLMGGVQQQHAPSAQQPQQHPMHQGPTQQQQQQQQQQSAYNSSFPYGHPYYSSPYQTAYANQFGYQQGVGGYGGSYPSKQQSMYGAPQGYGASYDQHSSSPANNSAFGQNQQASMRSASGMGASLGGSSLDDYGRSSAQPGSHSQSSGFGGMNDPFARSASGFGGQAAYGQQQQQQQGMTDDALKPFNDTKTGPSPALGQPGRPGSAANSAVGSAQTGLPQQQQQSAFGGYGGFPGQGSQYGGLGGLGGQSQHGQSGMGGQGGYGYGAGGFGQTYGGYGASRGGWGASYGAH